MRLLSGSARLAGVIGWPVAHSRSPRIHGTWLERHGIDGAYVPLAVRPADFETAVRGLAAAGFAGVNVTLPHKAVAFALADERDDAAAACGAVNTLVFSNGRILGKNTDGYGFVANLRAHGVDPAAGPALILGAGGAARAVGAALLAEGVVVAFCNRTDERAQDLATRLKAVRLRWEDRSSKLGAFNLLVNTTSLGMAGQPELDISLDAAPRGMVVADIVYAPLETKLLSQARAKNLRAVEGLGMLLHQAVPGFAAWFGVTPEVDADLYAVVSGGAE
jgi:shikimate dehydrogenase